MNQLLGRSSRIRSCHFQPLLLCYLLQSHLRREDLHHPLRPSRRCLSVPECYQTGLRLLRVPRAHGRGSCLPLRRQRHRSDLIVSNCQHKLKPEGLHRLEDDGVPGRWRAHANFAFSKRRLRCPTHPRQCPRLRETCPPCSRLYHPRANASVDLGDSLFEIRQIAAVRIDEVRNRLEKLEAVMSG